LLASVFQHHRGTGIRNVILLEVEAINILDCYPVLYIHRVLKGIRMGIYHMTHTIP
jgi:hypothetical protein